MPLVTLSDVLAIASREKSAIPAFNIDNLEISESVVEAAESLRRPIILAVGQNAIKMNGLTHIANIAKSLAASSAVPIVLHLDHGKSYEQVIACLRAGFSSVMIDGSSFPLEENIRLTYKVAQAAHAAGISVEAELGTIGGTEDDLQAVQANLVNEKEVVQFISQVNVDALAIGIGNAHGVYKGTPNLDFGLLRRVEALSPPPLVLHGGSGIPSDMIQEAIHLGIRKINIATELRLAYLSGIRETQSQTDIYKMFRCAKLRARTLAEEKIRLFSCI